MNHCIFEGNLVADPELRYIKTKKGEDLAVVSFKVGVNNRRNNTSFFPSCEAFGGTAEAIAKYFTKGKLIRVYGEFVSESWEKDGEKRYADKLKVEKFEFPPLNKWEGEGEGGGKKPKKSAPPIEDEDDGGLLPF